MMDPPTFLNRLINRLLGSRQTNPVPQPNPQRAVGETPPPETRKVSLIIYNPTIPSQSGRKLSQVLGWNDPDRLTTELINDLRDASHGYANYTVAERIEHDEFPVMIDGYQYTPDDYLHFWKARSGFHKPDAVNYHALLQKDAIIQKINQGVIDEVWMVFFPWGGLYESRMAGPGAFWCNAPPLENTADANRRFVIMCYNYERGVGEMLESYGHRAESILSQQFSRIPDPQNLWKHYTLYNKIAPGRAEVGTIHYAPNSRTDYDWGNLTPVPSTCRNWPYFPDLSGPPAMVNCREWGNGDIRAHHKWWFSLLPHVTGQTGAASNNWWEYILDPNRVT